MQANTFPLDLFRWADVSIVQHQGSDLIQARCEIEYEYLLRPRLAFQRHPSKVASDCLQLTMELESNVVRFVPQNRLHLLNRDIAATFAPGCPKFMRIYNRLFFDGIIQVGDMVALTKPEFDRYTKSSEVVAHVHNRLHIMKLGFGLTTPGWVPRESNY